METPPLVLGILAGQEVLGARLVHFPQVVLVGPSDLCGPCGLGFQGPQADPSHQAVLCRL